MPVVVAADAREREGAKMSVDANDGDTVGLAVLDGGGCTSSGFGSKMCDRCTARERGVPELGAGGLMKVREEATFAPLELGRRCKVGDDWPSSAFRSMERSVGRLDVGLGLAVALLVDGWPAEAKEGDWETCKA